MINFAVWCPSLGEDIYSAHQIVACCAEDAVESHCETIWRDHEPFDERDFCTATVEPGQEKWGAVDVWTVSVCVLPQFAAKRKGPAREFGGP